MVNRHLAAWLRPVLALLGFSGILFLSACGGGNGAPNNPYAPPPPVIPPPSLLPTQLTLYPGSPAVLTISGGVAPFRAFSTNPSTLPVASAVSGDSLVLAANAVAAQTTVNITVQDAVGTVSVPAVVNVVPAPLLPSQITVTANPNPACAGTTGNLCSGGTGTAVVKVTGAGGAGVPGRAVRYDVIQGNFQIVSTNPAQPLVSTLTTVTDANGDATVVLSVPADTPTQTGIIRATDVTTGSQVTGQFTILQVTTGGEVLAVLPRGTTTINGPDNVTCSSGVSVTNYIFGGTPPYQVGVNFPGAVSLSGVPVTKSGGAFTTTTNGTCFINLTYVITDATGRTIPSGNYPLVTNQVGTAAPTPPPTTLVVTPGAIAKNNCVASNTFQFIGTGGVAPYSAVVTATTSPTSPILSPQTGAASGQAITVSGLTSPSITTITLFDSTVPPQSSTVTIDCTGAPNPPPASALVVSPSTGYDFSASTCVNQTANFVVSGGTPPYNAFFATPRPGASINPGLVASSGQGFAVTGLTDGVLTTNITVQDSSVPKLQQVVTITCPTGPPPAQFTVTPGSYTYLGGAACAASASTFAITGGTAPFSVFFSTPGTAGVITPGLVQGNVAPNNQFTVSGLDAAPIPRVIQVTVRDSSATPQTQQVSVDCRTP